MPRCTSERFEEFASRLRTLERLRCKYDRLFARSQLANRDLESLYAWLLLSAHTCFEGLLEDLFFGLLVGRLTHPRKTTPLVVVRSDRVARRLALGDTGRGHLTWMPYSYTEDRARLFFSGGSPFCAIGDDQKETLRRVSLTRNVIAHASAKAARDFETKVLAHLPLADRDRTPGGFLRAAHIVRPSRVTRLTHFLEEFHTSAAAVCLDRRRLGGRLH